MKVSLTPILKSLRDIYDVEGVMPRFQAYRSLMLGTTLGEPLPLGVFSPMGKRQPDFLDDLIALGAERIATEAALEAATKLSSVADHYRLILVVVDVGRNGWTERYLTDAEWRFFDKYNDMPKDASPVGFDRWITVQLWTDEEPTATYIQRETQAAIYRAAHLRRYGQPKTLEEMIRQEGRARAFAGYVPELDADDIAYSCEVIEPYRDSADYATCFTALYGDDIARAVGYQPLGLSTRAGFNVGLADAWEEGSLEQCLRTEVIVGTAGGNTSLRIV